jgi:hypothetical protein
MINIQQMKPVEAVNAILDTPPGEWLCYGYSRCLGAPSPYGRGLREAYEAGFVEMVQDKGDFMRGREYLVTLTRYGAKRPKAVRDFLLAEFAKNY